MYVLPPALRTTTPLGELIVGSRVGLKYIGIYSVYQKTNTFNMKNPKKDRFEITELFMAQVNKDLCFYGTIKRSIDSDGNLTVFGRIKVGDVYVCARATDQYELGIKLDELVRMVYYGLI